MRSTLYDAALLVLACVILSACDKGRPVEKRVGVPEGHADIQRIHDEVYAPFVKDHKIRLPKSMDEMADYAVSNGKADPREMVSPYANDDEPRGYAWMPRREPDITKIWDQTVLVYDAAAEAQGYPAINVLIGEGTPVLVDRDELRRVMVKHGVQPSTAQIEVKGLEVLESVREMYPLR